MTLHYFLCIYYRRLFLPSLFRSFFPSFFPCSVPSFLPFLLSFLPSNSHHTLYFIFSSFSHQNYHHHYVADATLLKNEMDLIRTQGDQHAQLVVDEIKIRATSTQKLLEGRLREEAELARRLGMKYRYKREEKKKKSI